MANLQKHFGEVMKDCPSSTLIGLRANLERLHLFFETGQIRLGSACSGTDGVCYVLEIMFKAWHEAFGINLRIDHRWSCESVDWKQQFILDHFEPKVMFPDALKLKHEQAD